MLASLSFGIKWKGIKLLIAIAKYGIKMSDHQLPREIKPYPPIQNACFHILASWFANQYSRTTYFHLFLTRTRI